jgi:hypothetical protein
MIIICSGCIGKLWWGYEYRQVLTTTATKQLKLFSKSLITLRSL